MCLKDTWGGEFTEVAPTADEPVVIKHRYSGFVNTRLDSVLRTFKTKNLIMTGVGTNVCVESTLRDGFFLEYFGVVLHDATHQAGPDFMQKAALFNIENFFGWVSSVEEFRAALQSNANPSLKIKGET